VLWLLLLLGANCRKFHASPPIFHSRFTTIQWHPVAHHAFLTVNQDHQLLYMYCLQYAAMLQDVGRQPMVAVLLAHAVDIHRRALSPLLSIDSSAHFTARHGPSITQVYISCASVCRLLHICFEQLFGYTIRVVMCQALEFQSAGVAHPAMLYGSWLLCLSLLAELVRSFVLRHCLCMPCLVSGVRGC
jgi:hypothetical protein